MPHDPSNDNCPINADPRNESCACNREICQKGRKPEREEEVWYAIEFKSQEGFWYAVTSKTFDTPEGTQEYIDRQYSESAFQFRVVRKRLVTEVVVG